MISGLLNNYYYQNNYFLGSGAGEAFFLYDNLNFKVRVENEGRTSGKNVRKRAAYVSEMLQMSWQLLSFTHLQMLDKQILKIHSEITKTVCEPQLNTHQEQTILPVRQP